MLSRIYRLYTHLSNTLSTGSVIPFKMADFAVVIESFPYSVIAKLRAERKLSIDHSREEYIQFTWIPVSTETKRVAIKEDEVHDSSMQLVIICN